MNFDLRCKLDAFENFYLAVEDVNHTRTKANSPQTDGICKRFHGTVKDEFYDIASRT